jgi:protein-disulfide isomerase
VSRSTKFTLIAVGFALLIGGTPLFLEVKAKKNEAVASAEATAAAPSDSATAAFSPEQKAQLENVIRDFILNNPEVLMESVNKMREKQQQAQNEQSKEALKGEIAFLTGPDMPDAGNKKGDVTIIEFFDYNCGYCKKAFTDTVAPAVEADKNVRFVFIELPILSESSRLAAEYAMAAAEQGKYWEYHKALMNFKGPKTEETLTAEAQKIGLDVAKLKTDAKSQKVQDLLKKKTESAQKLAISGTPAFIVGDEIIRGFIPYDAMKPMIEKVRASAKAAPAQ